MKNGQLSSVQDDTATLRILERIYTSDTKPISLVSLETHTNLYFNRALLSMLGVEPQKVRHRNLKPLHKTYPKLPRYVQIWTLILTSCFTLVVSALTSPQTNPV
ncbi:hypothetical protein [Microseira sp. BLCC-F43]|uniref:hypothetical protein n=1 Tax=Microseira sp. BLCC-F43 TaxID=3153602 RepID=UPI0035BA87BC